MRVIVSGGGTGGHIYPAISIIEEFLRRDPNTEILYVGTQTGLEYQLVTREGYQFQPIHVRGIPRRLNKKSMEAFIELMRGLNDAKKILDDFKPDIVIGTGGFVSGPILFSASRRKNILTAFHEQNSFPGVTNRILSRFVDLYFVTFDQSLNYFHNTDRAIVTGNPIRNRFENLDEKKEEAYRFFQLDPMKKTVFSFGGSNGSKSINDAMEKVVEEVEKHQDFQVIHVTGKKFYSNYLQKFPYMQDSKNVRIFEYLNEMEFAYKVSDLVVTSSGAITLAELSFAGKPSILIPKAYTTENHQEYNAKYYESKGAGAVILESELNGGLLYEKIKLLLKDEKRLQKMGEISGELAMKDANKKIVEVLYETKNKKKTSST